MVVWNSAMDTTTSPYTPQAAYTRYQDLTGVIGNVTGPVNIGRSPILFETGAIPSR
jgi:hypothetical protein